MRPFRAFEREFVKGTNDSELVAGTGLIERRA
jgi:hypothetical protein